MICGLLTPDGGGGTCLGHDLVRERDAIKRQAGYMTQRFGLYEDLTIRENLEFVGRVYGLDRLKERVDQSLERLGLADAPEAARRRPVGRLEAAAGARRLRAARAQAAAARRADRRRRPQGAPRLLGRDPFLCRRGHHRAGLDPLHGRGRALSRDRLHRLRRADGARHGRRGDQAVRPGLLHRHAAPAPTASRRSCATRRASRPPPPSARRCMSAAPTATPLLAAIEPLPHDESHRLEGGRARRSRTCSST